MIEVGYQSQFNKWGKNPICILDMQAYFSSGLLVNMTIAVGIQLFLQKYAWSYVPGLEIILLMSFHENVVVSFQGKVTGLMPLSLYFLGFSFS